MLRLAKLLLLGLACRAFAQAAEPAPIPSRPWETSSFGIETGLLWEIGSDTSISYRLVPTQFSWRSRATHTWNYSDGSRLVFRHGLTVVATWIENGPESHYFAFNGSPSLEWWDRTGTWSLNFSAGGGFGWTDSHASEGGMGQDFTLNWFMRGGIEYEFAKNGRLRLGTMFQHMSNGGATDPNPGINALGVTLGWSWNY